MMPSTATLRNGLAGPRAPKLAIDAVRWGVLIKRPLPRSPIHTYPHVVLQDEVEESLLLGAEVVDAGGAGADFSGQRRFGVGDASEHVEEVTVLGVNDEPHFRNPRHDEFTPRNAWSLFDGFTEALKGNLAELPRRTERLHGLLDSEVGLSLAN